MSKTIIIDIFNPASIDAAVKEIREYSKWVQRKAEELQKKVADLIAEQAQPVFDTAVVDDTFLTVVKDGANLPESPKTGGVEVYAKPGENGVMLVIAHGEEAIWAEFGAGVHYNGAVGSYPNPLAETLDFVAAIGTYGKGYGAKETWGFLGSDGNIHLTHGAPASMPLYKAVQSVSRDIVRIAKEVFST
jgi:hypothetical protein